ncbi:DeoR/GlpR transcriptional regulator [Martelella lutilitoris]|uniref:DeoR/GlpR transcriptional regulator n=1 Tax=Martelella lutilitoris TaxID=2583532 RepID=A0A7T7KM99_9HYPH|nr:DeoR/GlpR family DNA-binding transcription regulator [Martelella lutilitoris]QQM31490.1 DeoR/GlpR transcriptional regulator [Martelella lutilitoris]
MNISDRQTKILALVEAHGSMTIEALAEEFSVSPQTIRRDVNMLCRADQLRRSHGGVERMSAGVNLSYDSRRLSHPEAKRRIGQLVAQMIPSRASVMFSIGTTPEMVAAAMVDHDDLTVVTNNLNVAMALSPNSSNRIFIPGGMIRLPDRDLIGQEVEAMFNGYRADFGIYGVAGVEPDGALVDFDQQEAAAREAIRMSCRTSILVADRSKFSRPAPAKRGRLGDADILVLDGPPTPEMAALIEAEGVDLRYPEGDLV